jgi:hypothetical protein
MTRCPSDLELEAVLRGTELHAEHVLACPRCAARVAEARRLEEEFRLEVFPATAEAVIARAVRPRRPHLVLWLAAPVLAAAGALLVVWLGSPPGFLGVNGSALTLIAYGPDPGDAHALADGEAVPAGAGLRFEVRPGRSCQLWVVSASAAGQVSRIYPPAGADGASVEAGRAVAVPGGAVLDGRPGPERIFALCGCGDEPLRFENIDRAARAVGASEERVRTSRKLDGLPADTLQATLLVEKRR